ncbi:rhodanese-like domain-containing protein [Paenibacillus endoradicis]|uniref:rhodanese-like domain-containing protein n=1 Tax=Paenibacillus endoradicis TaxID=2972487 RepID=UPI002158AC4E|nr:rhodanese-like domain-containing protein [Paenibacillus endoradicis]MCR8657164.1 rhodanese-like domain-containing protein [Paenibacillus endoradicis]
MGYIIAIIVIVLWWLINRKATAGIKQISAATLTEILASDEHVFIDVRTPAEYNSNHIKQFRNIPLGSDMTMLPKDKDIVVICQSGMRSMQACKRLKKLGYTSITNVKGGMTAYKIR